MASLEFFSAIDKQKLRCRFSETTATRRFRLYSPITEFGNKVDVGLITN